MSTGLELDPGPFLVTRDCPATHVCFPMLGTEWRNLPIALVKGQTPRPTTVQNFLSFSLFVYIQLNSNVLPE